MNDTKLCFSSEHVYIAINSRLMFKLMFDKANLNRYFPTATKLMSIISLRQVIDINVTLHINV